MTMLADWIVLPLIVLGIVCGLGLMMLALWIVTAAAVGGLRDRRAAAKLPRRTPGAALEATEKRDQRLAHLDAVLAECATSPRYVTMRLAPFEADVSDLLELVLELDDQRGPADIG